MGRPKAFDMDETLGAAMGAFRARGFEATSLKGLESLTGLGAGSLYNAFGSKEALFLAALDHYNERVVKRRIATYLKGESPVRELRALFLSTLKEPGGTTHGCLLTNSAIEFAGSNAPVAAKVEDGFELLERAFQRQCRTARDLGLAPSSLDPRRAALRLLHAYQGLLVLVRSGRRAGLAALVDDTLNGLFQGV
ncbi:MAG TPA: TetR/AcrR family transcriptional regulator [Holophagaceae bacterium]|nr:TetR/AcrR family transcriptional regulator [Holophagaceae bacterium]